jgi:hypothetical protein
MKLYWWHLQEKNSTCAVSLHRPLILGKADGSIHRMIRSDSIRLDTTVLWAGICCLVTRHPFMLNVMFHYSCTYPAENTHAVTSYISGGHRLNLSNVVAFLHGVRVNKFIELTPFNSSPEAILFLLLF